MSCQGDCHDTAVAAAFCATLEPELLADPPFLARAAARAAIFDFLTWYNAERLHSSLGDGSPVAYEQHLRAQPARAASPPCPPRRGKSS